MVQALLKLYDILLKLNKVILHSVYLLATCITTMVSSLVV